MKLSNRSNYKLAMATAIVAAGAFTESSLAANNLVTYNGTEYQTTWSSLPNVSANATIATLTSGLGTTSNPADLSTAFESANQSGSPMLGLPAQPALDGWWFASASTAQKVAVGSPSTTTGALFLSGTTPNQSIGLISTNSTGLEYFGVEIQNETGGNLNTLAVNFNDVLIWQNTGAKSLDFGYFVDNSSAVGDSLPTSGLNGVSALTGSFSTSAAVGSTESQTDTITLTGSNVLANNGAIWLVFSTSSTTGTSQGLGMNGFNATLTESAAPSVTWHTGSGTWDNSTANWTGGSTTYADPDSVTFGNIASASTVTIQGAGVSPGSITINNTSGFKYTFAGGSINGSGSLAINAGTAELSAADGYSGGTNINGGTLIADGDSTLGNASGGIVFGGGILQAGAAIGSTATPSQRSITVNTGGGTFNTNGFNSVFSSSVTTALNAPFNVTGTGSLELNGTVTTSGTGALNIASGATLIIGPGSVGTISQINNSNYDGKLVVSGTPRLNVDANSTLSSQNGTGEIDVVNAGTVGSVTTSGMTPVTYNTYQSGVTFTTASGDPGGTIDLPIKLNSTNQSYTPADVTQASLSLANNFTTTIGGTTGGTITLNGVISGNSDVNIANSTGGGGKGGTVFGAANTYTGTTLINTNGTFQTAVNNAIPYTSNVIFGTIQGAEGMTTELDLDGTTEQIASLSTGQWGKGADEKITNNSAGNSPATLTVSGSLTPANSFMGTINDGNGTVALVKGGTSTLALAGVNAYSGGTTVTGGTLLAGNASALGTPNNPLTVNTPGLVDLNGNSPSIGNISGSGTIDNVSAAGTPTLSIFASTSSNFSGVIQNTTGSVALDMNVFEDGNGTQTLSGPNTYTGGTTVSTGTLVIAPTSTPNAVALPNGPVNVAGGATLQLADNASASTPFTSSAADISNQLMQISSLSIATGGVMDIRNNHFYVADPGGTPDDATYTSILGWVENGAITSTEGVSGYGVGIVDGNDGVSGAKISAGQIEVAYTLDGDANLDGKVDITDFNIFAPDFGSPTTLGWEAGDFGYFGNVNITDFNLFAGNFGASDSGTAVSMPAADFAALHAFEAANGLTLTSVPEPASLSLLALGTVGIMARRRRRQ